MCDDGLTCRNPLSLISPRPSAPSPSLFPLLSRHSISPSRHTHIDTLTNAHPLTEAHTQKHADTHVLYICAAFIRLGLNVCCCPVASLQSSHKSTGQISIPRSLHPLWPLYLQMCISAQRCYHFFGIILSTAEQDQYRGNM